MHYGHEFGGGLMWSLWVLVIVVFAWALINGALMIGRESSKKQKSALDSLKDRYANGEIDEEEFDQQWVKLSSRIKVGISNEIRKHN